MQRFKKFRQWFKKFWGGIAIALVGGGVIVFCIKSSYEGGWKAFTGDGTGGIPWGWYVLTLYSAFIGGLLATWRSDELSRQNEIANRQAEIANRHNEIANEQARIANEQARIANKQAENASRQNEIARDGQWVESYGRAVGQLGHGEKVIRRGGLSALERLAQVAHKRGKKEDKEAVIHMLCNFVRER